MQLSRRTLRVSQDIPLEKLEGYFTEIESNKAVTEKFSFPQLVAPFPEHQPQKCLHPCVQTIFSRILCALNKPSCRHESGLPERLPAAAHSYRAAVLLLQLEKN